jgi:hypothetical protein
VEYVMVMAMVRVRVRVYYETDEIDAIDEIDI